MYKNILKYKKQFLEGAAIGICVGICIGIAAYINNHR